MNAGQLEFVTESKKELKLQMQHLQFLYDSLFYTNKNGDKLIKPNVTVDQVRSITQKITKLSSIYRERAESYRKLNELRDEVCKEWDERAEELKEFSKNSNIELPDVLKRIFNLG